jgi:ribosome-associated protein
MLPLSPSVSIPDEEIEFSAIRAQGAGGQNVNKVSSAIHLRFDVRASSLPEEWKARILATRDQRITREGVIVIKAQQSRSQDRNRAAALARLHELIRAAIAVKKKRRPTRPTHASRKKRVEGKVLRGRIKALRRSAAE